MDVCLYLKASLVNKPNDQPSTCLYLSRLSMQTSIMGSDISHQGYVVVGIMVDADEVARSLSDNRHGANYDQASIRFSRLHSVVPDI